MSELSGRHPPGPPSERGAPGQSTPKISQSALSNIETAIAPIDLQARRLRQLFFFQQETARTVAQLAFGGLAR
jgi:hypothetical protein